MPWEVLPGGKPQGVQAQAGEAADPSGSVMLHPAASAGTKASVVGAVRKRDDVAGWAPNESGSVVVHA